MIKFLQSNANHCKAAMDLLRQFELENHIGVSIISEPHNIPNDCTWFQNSRGTVTIHWNNQCLEDIGVLMKRGRYSVSVKWKNFAVVACYISPNVGIEEYSRFLNEIDAMVMELRLRWTIIAGDFNAKDRSWGAHTTDDRGEKISRWAASRDLRLLNDGLTPTCVRHQGNSIIDLTWSTPDLYNQICNWKVMEEFTYSDHMYIAFRLRNIRDDNEDIYNDDENGNIYNDGVNMYRDREEHVNMYIDAENPQMGVCMNVKKKEYIRWNHKKMDPEMFVETLEWKYATATTVDTVEKAAQWLSEAYAEACDMSMPRLKKIKRHQVYWWSSVIADLRKTCRQARKRWQKHKTRRSTTAEQLAFVGEQYRVAKSLLRKEINKSKEKAWEELIQTIESDPWGLPYKVVLNKLRRTPCTTEVIPVEILNTTLDDLFPYDASWDEQVEELPLPFEAWNEEDQVTFAEVHNFMRKRMTANTAPGRDGVKALYMKKSPDSMVSKIVECLNTCLQEGHFPKVWKKAVLVLVPKGALNIYEPKVRPICLLNELGKLFERILVSRMEDYIFKNPERPGRKAVWISEG